MFNHLNPLLMDTSLQWQPPYNGQEFSSEQCNDPCAVFFSENFTMATSAEIRHV